MKVTRPFDPNGFFYGPGKDKAGMRCVGKMSKEELRQALCRSLEFRHAHDTWRVAYTHKREMEEAVVSSFFASKH